MIDIRPAGQDDSWEIFVWRNDATTRAMSHVSEPLTWESHRAWFEATLSNPTRHLLICAATRNGEKIAIVRFDMLGSQAVLSLNLAPAMRGQGLAKPCLRQAIAHIRQCETGLSAIGAEIKDHNIASIRAFEGVGFLHVDTVDGTRYYRLEI